jgi:hypothetical protein
MSEVWHYAEGGVRIGPVNFEQLIRALSKSQNPRDVLVWSARFPEWVRAGRVLELAEMLPPPLPLSVRPEWRVPWWYVVPFICLAVGSRVGRTEMGRVSALRS